MVLIWVSLIICCHVPTLISNIYLTTLSIECSRWRWNSHGKVLLDGKCPFVRTKKLSRQIIFCPLCQCPWIFGLYYFLSIWPLICYLDWFMFIFFPIVQKKYGTFSGIFNKFLWILLTLIITTCVKKILKQVTYHSTQNFIS